MPKALIVSLGGSHEPILKSIKTHSPELVCFFASESSVENVGKIKDVLEAEMVELENKNFITEDAEDLVTCYSKAVSISKWLEDKGVSPDEVVVDYTGGTKSMTAALALATVGKGYSFSYVGGKERTKSGLGQVITGTEIVKNELNPWEIFAVEEKKLIATYVNSYQFEAASYIAAASLKRVGDAETFLLEGFERLFRGYSSWEKFRHCEAIENIKFGLKVSEDYVKLQSDPQVGKFAASVRNNLSFLQKLQFETKGFKKLHGLLVVDLISNAERRAEEMRYDDGVARLYRALEMIGQMNFEQALGCSTDNVDPEKIPENLKEKYICLYKDDSSIKLPLMATFDLLREIGDETGLAFSESREEFKKLLHIRNFSVLAHGINPIDEGKFRKMDQLIRETFNLREKVDFPKLEW